MAENNFDIGSILGGVLNNPELLGQAMGLAKQLKDGGLLSGLQGMGGAPEPVKAMPDMGYNLHNGAAQNAVNAPTATHNSSKTPTRSNVNAFYSPSFGEEYSFPYGRDGAVWAFRQPDVINADPTPRFQTPVTLPAFLPEQAAPSCGCGSGGGNHNGLLEALRPYLGEGRQSKLDFILKILNLMQLADKSGIKIF